jgi:protein-S-isoprenylcysteine O-methyltransferase Ste14
VVQGTPVGLTIRSLFWTVLLPGVFAGYVPWRYFGLGDIALDLLNPLNWIALIAIGLGTILLAACVLEFARRGRGTLSPVDPPRTLVVQGPYRYVRNPMYLAVTAIVLGEVLLTRSRGLLLYWMIWFAAVNLFVIAYEEPTLRRQFGAVYERYTANVRRWIPRLHAWSGAILFAFFVVTKADAQERWVPLSGAAADYSVDLHSLHQEAGVVRGRVQSHDVGAVIVVEELEVRCATAQLRTIRRRVYDSDTGRPIRTGSTGDPEIALWAEYGPGSQGHALMSGLCRLARERGLVGLRSHSGV